MPTPEELNAIAENLGQMQLGLDDTFRFKCHGCGKCCKNREDILLTPRDLFRLAKCMGLTPTQTMDRCCESYIGGQTGIPTVRLKPVGKNKVCPLLKENKCSVHASKPVVCALFPLGRFQKPSKDDPRLPGESGYLLMPTSGCGRTFRTVRAYLESFGIPLEDVFHAQWNGTLMFLVDFFRDALRAGTPQPALNTLRDITFVLLYLRYDTESEFLPQFEASAATLKELLNGIRAKAFPPKTILDARPA